MQIEIEFPEKISEYVLKTRKSLGLGRTEFANLLGMNSQGERTIRGWETGEHIPTKNKLQDIKNLKSNLNFGIFL